MHVGGGVCVRVCVRACVRYCVMQISPKLLQLQIFCKLIVPMNFHALEHFVGFVDLGLVTTYFVSTTYFVLPDLFCINF